MKRKISSVVVSMLFLITWGPLAPNRVVAQESSSEIPDRREFPVNQDIDPCEDFYQYACSKVISTFKLRDDRSRHVFSFSDSHERLLSKRMEFMADLAETKSPDGLSDRVRDMQNVYNACMNAEARKVEEREMVAKILAEVDALQNHDQFQRYIARQVTRPQFSFVAIEVDNNLDDSSWDDIWLESPLLYLGARPYYEYKDDEGKAEFEERWEAYRQVLIAFYQTVGLSDPAQRADAVLEFERSFALTYPYQADIRDMISDRSTIMTQEEVLQAYPRLRLDTLLSRVPGRILIRNKYKDSFAFLNQALDPSGVSLQALKSLYLFRALHGYLDDAYPEFFDVEFAFRHKYLGGPEVRSERSERCTQVVMNTFEHEIDFELLPRVFPNFPKQRFTQLIERVRSTIGESLESNDWLSDESKKEALLKLRTARLQLFTPDQMDDWDFNPEAEYSPARHYENLRTVRQNRMNRTIDELALGHNKTRWFWGPLTVNAAASPNDNRFNFPAGILVHPFYDPEAPDHVNLGAIGSVIGHELGHLFDDKGAKYDHQGTMRDWMPNEDLDEFKARGDIFIKQFEDIGHNGRYTQGENIGDFTGLTFAYETAFQNGEGARRAKQEFFLQWGRGWCAVMRDSTRERLLQMDSHSLPEARVNEQMKHQPGFHEAYGCQEGDALYLPPEERADIW